MHVAITQLNNIPYFPFPAFSADLLYTILPVYFYIPTICLLYTTLSLFSFSLLTPRLLPYGCIATGSLVGFIECIGESETIANIQKAGKKSAMKLWDSNLLYEWLKKKNPKPAE